MVVDKEDFDQRLCEAIAPHFLGGYVQEGEEIQLDALVDKDIPGVDMLCPQVIVRVF